MLKCLKSGLSSTSVNHLHGRLHQALSSAVRLGLVARVVAELVDPPRVNSHEMHPLSREEARSFLEVTAEHRYGVLFAVALATGMRQGELLGLKWSDLDVDGYWLQVKRAVRYTSKRGFVWTDCKTKRSRRRIAFSHELADLLGAHRVRQVEQRRLVGEVWEDGELVFCTSTGRPVMARAMLHQFKKLLVVGHLADIRFHDLRHTAATLLLGARVNPKIVSEMLGHASVAITLDIYSHVLPDMQQDTAATMASMLFE